MQNSLFFIFLVSWSSLTLSSKIRYSDTLARQKMIYAAISVYSEFPDECLNQLGSREIRRRITVALEDSEETFSGFVGVSLEDRAILMVFGGMVSENMVERLAENQTAWPAGGLVSKYFHDGFFKIWNGGMKDDFSNLTVNYPEYQVWVTGHSLGGSLASLAASYITFNRLFSSESLLLMTFGQPRTGNQEFAESFNREVINAFRITHSHDPIPQLPQKGRLGYWHHKSEVFYNKKMTGWEICEEDEGQKCSNRNLDNFDFQDHLHYFNLDIPVLGSSNCQNSTLTLIIRQ